MTALERFCDIIQKEMVLARDQVYLWDQRIRIPPDDRLYVSVGVLTVKPFGNANRIAVADPTDPNSPLMENQSVNVQAILSVNIFSRPAEARDRKEEVILALASTYSKIQQDTWGFLVGKLPSSFVDLSNLEGSAIPYRFNISVAIQYFITKQKAVPYYDTIQGPTLTTEG